MTREERRLDAATNYGYAVAGGCLERPIISNAFLKGTEWADEHPMKGMVSLDEVCNMLYAMLDTQDINDYDYVTAPAYDNVEDFVDDFRKAMEEK